MIRRPIKQEDFFDLIEFFKENSIQDLSLFSSSLLDHRLRVICEKYKFSGVSEITNQFKAKTKLSKTILLDLNSTFREFFRDPIFLRQFRKRLPYIFKLFDSLKVWIPYCGNGMEAYTFAIMIKEAGGADKVEIIVSDPSEEVLSLAKEGKYHMDLLPKHILNYEDSGGKAKFTDYIIKGTREFEMSPELKSMINFVDQEKCITDRNMFHLIFCRDALINYSNGVRNDQLLQVVKKLYTKGILCLGQKEPYPVISGMNFKIVKGRERVFQLIKNNR